MSKHKKHSGSKGKHGGKKKDKIKYETRIDYLLSQYPEDILELWFGDDEEKRKEFGLWLLKQDELDSVAVLECDDSDSIYIKKIREERYREHTSIKDIHFSYNEILYLQKKNKKGKKIRKKFRNKDLGIATFLNTKKYRKSYLNNEDYRKYLKKLAKQEKKDTKEMINMGYIKSNDPEKELKKLLEKSNSITESLSDSYVQKYFIK